LFLAALGVISFLATPVLLRAQADAAARARISEERRTLTTYPFALPNRVPILVNDARLYPYHRFEGYAHTPEQREWTLVHLENEWIELWVMPEVGGKVWGARVKESGHEFIYRNEVMKFRNIALRGPWTSGGIEFNFGVIGHTPATATPVDWLTRENDDGSVSVFVGAMDLPSRTSWRVEVRLPADAAYFETRAQWQNPTPLEQPYYNWMTGAAFARDDLVMSIPGNAYLEHPGGERAWPVDAEGRRLPVYDENRFGGNKSYHVVGELNDFFGGYYQDDDWGFGHWSRYEEMPGQKLWLWALSRQGGIWDDLLTDTDGQYVEFQAGRLLVQYSPSGEVNPIAQAGFDPGATDRWTETWFPVEGLGGLTEASRDGAMHLERTDGRLRIRAHAFVAADTDVQLWVDDVLHASEATHFEVLEPVSNDFDVPAGAESVRVEVPGLGLVHDLDPSSRALTRPFTTDLDAMPAIPEVTRRVMAASELVQGRMLEDARTLYESVLDDEPWNRDALLGMADLDYRRGLYAEGLGRARKALQLDAYDAEANFVAGTLYRSLGERADAVESFGWAARSMAFRSVALVQLAELALAAGDPAEARRYALQALDYDRQSSFPRRVLAVAARVSGDVEGAGRWLAELEELDPLDHFVAAEHFLGTSWGADAERVSDPAGVSSPAMAFTAGLRGEYPDQEILELALRYHGLGRTGDAVRLLDAGLTTHDAPVLRAWMAYLAEDDTRLAEPADPTLAFPFRAETIEVLRHAVERGDEHWSWRYLLALNLWARDRAGEAMTVMAGIGDESDFAPLYTARAALAGGMADGLDGGVGRGVGGTSSIGLGVASLDPEADLRRAIALDPSDRNLRAPLVQYLQTSGRWEDALAESSSARRTFPGDFDFDLLHATSLVETGRFGPAMEILDEVAVLPSEHSSQAHVLFAHAHTMAGLDALKGDASQAARHFETAMTWPEHLGQGRPYDPEERLPRYLLGVSKAAAGDDAGAREEFERVVLSTPPEVFTDGARNRLDVLAVLALDALDRASEAGVLRSSLDELMAFRMERLADVEGRLLYQALTLAADTGR
jgi:tetratricopeptide (TPR) repeat protein